MGAVSHTGQWEVLFELQGQMSQLREILETLLRKEAAAQDVAARPRLRSPT